MAADRWEYGSDFDLVDAPGARTELEHPWAATHVLAGSGRDALRVLLAHGTRSRGWRRIWLPAYFCIDVVDAVSASGLEHRYYDIDPLARELPQIDARPGSDVVYRVNFFGLQSGAPANSTLPDGVEVIEDHSHDPWSAWAYASEAEWCVASLRKTLPIPDGGVLWSPSGETLPAIPPLTEHHRCTAAMKLAGMALKSRYLRTGDIAKATFRELLVGAESRLAEGETSGISPAARDMLAQFPALAWRSIRQRNHRLLLEEGQNWPATQIHAGDAAAVPLAMIVSFANAQARDAVRQALIARSVYPAVLWESLPDAPPHRFSEQMLALHCDGRYSDVDVARVASIVHDVLMRTVV